MAFNLWNLGTGACGYDEIVSFYILFSQFGCYFYCVGIIKKHDTIARGIEREVGSELIRALENDGISFLTERDIEFRT